MLALTLTLASSHMVDLYVGTYTAKDGSRGVYRVGLDEATGALSTPELAAECQNPSYLALDPKGRHLYAVNELDQGRVSAYAVGKDGGLRFLNEADTHGSAPCHLAVDPKAPYLLVANYGSGTLARIGLAKDGSLGEVAAFANKGKGADPNRQDGPHAHCVAFLKGWAYTCDLGTDEVLLFRDPARTWDEPERTKLKGAAGPRHLAFGKGGHFAYVCDELDNQVVAFAVDPGVGTLTAIQTVSALPEGFAGTSHTSEIAVHPNGRFLYVSNRGHDSIAVFEIQKDGTLRPAEVQKTLKEPRGFAIDPSGRWIVVAGQNEDRIASYPLDPKTGRLGDPAGEAKVGKPVCVVVRL